MHFYVRELALSTMVVLTTQWRFSSTSSLLIDLAQPIIAFDNDRFPLPSSSFF